MINDSLPVERLYNATLISGEPPIPRRPRFNLNRILNENAHFRLRCARQMVQHSYREFLFIPEVATLVERLAVLVAHRCMLIDCAGYEYREVAINEIDEKIHPITSALHRIINQSPASWLLALAENNRIRLEEQQARYPLRTEENEDDFVSSVSEEEVDWLREGF